MTIDERKKLYAALSAPFPEECIERTSGRDTGKPYDTAGVRAQFLINRINEVIGVGGFRIHRTVEVREITTAKGRPMWEAHVEMTVELGSYRDGNFVAFADSLSDGSHVAASKGDSIKGAHTNAFKRCVAAFGIGKAAWEGTLDDDNVPLEPREVTSPPRDTRVPVENHSTTAPASEAVTPQPSARNRVTSRQIAAIHSLARKCGLEPSVVRAEAKKTYGATLEFISSSSASDLISRLKKKLESNGHAESNGVAQAS